jgi:hypothetical protein
MNERFFSRMKSEAPFMPPHRNGLSPGFQPGEDFVGVLIRWKNRIENFGDFTAFDDPSHAFDKPEASIFKGGELEGIDKFEAGVTKDFKGEVNAVDKFLLIFSVLSAGTENLKAKLLEFPVEIAKAAGVRCAAASTRDDIPFLRDRLMRLGIARIEKNNSGNGEFGEVDEPASGAGERNGGQCAAGQMTARAIIFWLGKRGRQIGEI